MKNSMQYLFFKILIISAIIIIGLHLYFTVQRNCITILLLRFVLVNIFYFNMKK